MGRRNSHIPRTLAALKTRGYVPETVERFNSWSRTRNDFYGFADMCGISVTKGMLLVQVCSQSTYGAHRKKLLLVDHMKTCYRALRGRVKIEIWAWDKRQINPGNKALRWGYNLYRYNLRRHDFELVALVFPNKIYKK